MDDGRSGSFSTAACEELPTELIGLGGARADAGGLPSPRPKAISWNAALDVWLLAEMGALCLMIAGITLLFGQRAPDLWNVPVIGLGWIGSFAALSWFRRSLHSGHPRSDAIHIRLADWLKASAAVLLFCFLTEPAGEFSRPWGIAVLCGGGVTIALVGVLARATIFSLTESGALGTRIAIYGCGEGTKELIDSITADRGPAARIEGLFDERSGRGPGAIDSRLVNRDIDQLIASAKARQIDAVMLNLPWSAYDRIESLVHRLEQVNVDILMAPSRVQIHGGASSIGFIGSIPTLSLYRRPMTGLRALGKTLLDRMLAGLGLILLSPALLLLALLIRLDSPGPILFRQKRRGMNNEPFDMLKFRSMYAHTEDRKAEKLVTRGDSRVTRVGGFIRRTSIDELPQLINVLRGDMSLVGPRPHVCEAKAADRLYEEVVRRYPARHRVLPGITGLAQVRGFRGNGWDETEIVDRVKSDLEYIDRWSLGLDIAILLRTVATVLFQRGVY
jgi:Undecaprenyl-phosphate glucose phosphotransferase